MHRPTLSCAFLAAALIGTAAAMAPAVPYPPPPQVLFGDLFVAVQRARVFADGKEFADAVPDTPPERVLADYHRARPATPEALRRFVAAHFELPPRIAAPAASTERLPMGEHIDRLWQALTRSTPFAAPYSSLLALPHPYVVPGGRFRELYYWDSYFTMLGLAQSGRQDLVDAMVRDFAHLIDTYGHVPNGTRTYYLSRSQPPLFFAMVGLRNPADPAAAYAEYLPQLEREHAFWMRGAAGLRRGTAAGRVVALADGALLNRYWDDRDSPRDESYREDTELAAISGREPRQLYRDVRAAAESGWDFSSRWFADGATRATLDTTQIVPVDLNSLMFGLETAIAAGCERRGDLACAHDFEHRAARRRAAIERYLWDSEHGAYLDYRWPRRTRIARVSAATLYPLFVGLAADFEAAAVARTVGSLLLKPGGVVTTLADTGEQWDSPNGWAPLQWIAVDGLRRYHQDELATTIACRWMSGVNRVYRDSGKLVEKYDVVDTGRGGGGGEYPTQDGFGWTNGVSARLAALYPAEAHYAAVEDCPSAPDTATAVNVK
jgi:alpha,alpha-trehalase